ncbi:hypothetical protein ITP53_54130 [Nonomuraea sp. K274]|uniref:Uncharacterized protein n=1 Tax=Nonomuraea cypriaca TaxID=1187855 RepID=A0A931F690_9ACTN|nr:hypothetical protein [Nonomuraea cypriaca]
MSIRSPKGPSEQGPPQPPADEGAVTTRIQLPKGSPGQQVYPLPPQQMGRRPGPPQQQTPQGPQQGPYQGAAQQGAQQGAPQQGVHDGQGLGTDLFAIAGREEQQPEGNRNGMLVLMAVAAAAAVVIAVLIVALFSS